MSISSKVIESYGETVTINGAPAKGFITVIDTNEPMADKMPMKAGVKNTVRYRFITSYTLPEAGMKVVHGDSRFVILRVERVDIFGSFSHNECLMRKENAL